MSNALGNLLEGKIDFAGQSAVEQIAKVTLLAGTGVSFVAGFALQDLRVTFGLYGAIVIVLALAVLPPWPVYNRNPVKWVPAQS